TCANDANCQGIAWQHKSRQCWFTNEENDQSMPSTGFLFMKREPPQTDKIQVEISQPENRQPENSHPDNRHPDREISQECTTRISQLSQDIESLKRENALLFDSRERHACLAYDGLRFTLGPRVFRIYCGLNVAGKAGSPGPIQAVDFFTCIHQCAGYPNCQGVAYTWKGGVGTCYRVVGATFVLQAPKQLGDGSQHGLISAILEE
ncbi:hypothetical protein FQN49_000432, partial [Arthroderma sp. PD_2]